MSLVGEGLHELLGLHHGPVVSERDSVLGFSYGYSSNPGNGRYVGESGHREDRHDAATCPICQYLAQGQVIGERVEVASVAVSVPDHRPLIPLFTPNTVLQPFQAPAPPAV